MNPQTEDPFLIDLDLSPVLKSNETKFNYSAPPKTSQKNLIHLKNFTSGTRLFSHEKDIQPSRFQKETKASSNSKFSQVSTNNFMHYNNFHTKASRDGEDTDPKNWVMENMKR